MGTTLDVHLFDTPALSFGVSRGSTDVSLPRSFARLPAQWPGQSNRHSSAGPPRAPSIFDRGGRRRGREAWHRTLGYSSGRCAGKSGRHDADDPRLRFLWKDCRGRPDVVVAGDHSPAARGSWPFFRPPDGPGFARVLRNLQHSLVPVSVDETPVPTRIDRVSGVTDQTRWSVTRAAIHDHQKTFVTRNPELARISIAASARRPKAAPFPSRPDPPAGRPTYPGVL